MKGLKRVRLGLAGVLAAALVAVGAFLVVSQVSAVSGTLSISSPMIALSGSGSADLRSNVPAPGLGAWTVDITYDATKVTVGSCAPASGGVCNPHYTAGGGDKVRITGASANGLTGDTSLGTVMFTCGSSASTSSLSLATSVFADATVGSPQNITMTSTTNGTITCAAAAATVAPSLGATGQGPSGGSSSSYDWLIVSLAGAGLALLAGFGALRLRGNAA